MSKSLLIDESQLSLALIEAQYQVLKNKNLQQGKGLLIILSGIELAGKGRAVKQLREWLDPRYLNVKTLAPQQIDGQAPVWLRYTPEFPAIGQMTIMFGAWYSDLFATMMHQKSFDEQKFIQELQRIEQFERDLANNHLQVVKIWFDLSWKTLQKRLDDMDAKHLPFEPLHGIDWRNKKHYQSLQHLRQSFTADWLVVDGEHRRVGQYQFAQYVLQSLQQPYQPQNMDNQVWHQQPLHPRLLNIIKQKLKKDEYKQKIKQLSKRLAEQLRQEQRHVVLVFEGMDASGKGGAIKRIIKHLDPREYDIYCISAPETDELRRPYLWRFWTKLAQGRNIKIFDRSWYGRVLVERVEGFAQAEEWQRAYAEINRFEQALVENNSVVIKFWLATSPEEQLHRFEQREQTPHKRFKITAEDWRNRAKWQDYIQACSDMLHYTHTASAPWHIIATDDKYTARVMVLEHILQQLYLPE